MRIDLTFRDGSTEEIVLFDRDVEDVQHEVDDAFTQQSYLYFPLRQGGFLAYNTTDIRKVWAQPVEELEQDTRRPEPEVEECTHEDAYRSGLDGSWWCDNCDDKPVRVWR